MKYLITEDQYERLFESKPGKTLSPALRRRITPHDLKVEIDFALSHLFNPCSFRDPSDFVGEVCDHSVSVNIDDIEESTDDFQATPSDRDQLFYYCVDLFQPYLLKYYHDECDEK